MACGPGCLCVCVCVLKLKWASWRKIVKNHCFRLYDIRLIVVTHTIGTSIRERTDGQTPEAVTSLGH